MSATPEHLQGKTVRELRELARAAAQASLDVHWPEKSIPVDPVAIARGLGISVFTAQLGEDVFGLLVGNGDGVTIYVDRDSAPVRQRFTIAHEVGHAVSHESELATGDIEFVDARSTSGTGTASEVYANEFAAELLMPQEQFRAAVRTGRGDIELAAEFQVSLQAFGYRRQVLRV